MKAGDAGLPMKENVVGCGQPDDQGGCYGGALTKVFRRYRISKTEHCGAALPVRKVTTARRSSGAVPKHVRPRFKRAVIAR